MPFRRCRAWVLASSVLLPAALACAAEPPASSTFAPSTAPTASAPSSSPASSTGPATAAVAADLRTVATAVTASVTTATRPAAAATAQPGYLGVTVSSKDARTTIDYVDPQSPAAAAGLAAGDQLLAVNGEDVGRPGSVADALLRLSAGDAATLAVARGTDRRDVRVTLAAVSKPMKVSGVRAVMGVQLREAQDGDGAVIAQITKGGPADQAGLKAGDVILRIDDAAVGATSSIAELLAGAAPDDTIAVRYRRDGRAGDARVTLAADPRSATDNRTFSPANIFKKNVYRLGVVGIEYPDAKHSDKIAPKDWEAMLFSSGTYTDKNVTGQQVYGSLNDYYREVSCGKLKVEGRMFDWVTVAKNRADYGQGSGDRRLLNEAVDAVLKRDGKDAVGGFDGLLFVYAGGRVQTNRGNVYWPHKGLMFHQNKRFNYFICPEGGERMANISVFAHEFGHMVGIPDLYARPENPGSEGLGQWCLMSNQLGNGRPQHMSAWCKEQLGWLTPAVVDPAVRQHLVLSPVEGSPTECFKILARADGTEYFLLEVRKKTGFDLDLPGDGLLVWRVVRGRPILEESHGVDGPLGPRSFLRQVPYPSPSNRAFTPFTTPSSRPQLGGGLPVFVTDVERLPDGRVSFRIGYETF
jgi:M6 family metalloprotease-like protein